MNFGFKHYFLALGILSVDTANGQLCTKDHDILSHNIELNVTVTCKRGDPDAFFGIVFEETAGSPYNGIVADGWCVDVDRAILCDDELDVDTFSSYDTDNIREDAIDKVMNLDLLNWLINTYPIGTELNITGCYEGPLLWPDYQKAVWRIIDDSTDFINATVTDCVVDWLGNETINNGEEGYSFDCKDVDAKIGVILIADSDDGEITDQVIMAEIPLANVSDVCDCQNGTVGGDPHFRTWAGEAYDFHGICDLTLLTNPYFMDGLGMDINIRTKKMQQWSYISTAVLRIEDDTFEVAGHQDGNTYWLNGKEGPSDGLLEELMTIAGYPITFSSVHSHQREYVIHISEVEKIKFSTWKDFVRVDFEDASKKNFHGSMGLMGSFDQKGVKLGRDGVTVFTDVDKFGMDWQVPSAEASFFHAADGPQYPTLCELPSKTTLRRRLAESAITEAEAELACSPVRKEERSMCVFDVMATGDIDVAGAY